MNITHLQNTKQQYCVDTLLPIHLTKEETIFPFFPNPKHKDSAIVSTALNTHAHLTQRECGGGGKPIVFSFKNFQTHTRRTHCASSPPIFPFNNTPRIHTLLLGLLLLTREHCALDCQLADTKNN